jgi:uncharacterized protein YkwD
VLGTLTILLPIGALVVAGVAIATGYVSVPVAVPDPPEVKVPDPPDISSSSPDQSDPPVDGNTGENKRTEASGGVTTDTVSLDTERVERLVHQEINDRRKAHGLEPLQYDSELAAIAQRHSTDMALQGYYSHDAPNGSDFTDRYERAGYACRQPISGQRYAIGAENILYTFYNTRLAKEGDSYYDTPEELAEGMVESWMNSQGHRENILQPYWENEGIGIATRQTDNGLKVYATQNFC